MVATKNNDAVQLVSMGKHKPDDHRAKLGGPLEVGQFVTLSFHTEHGIPGGYWKYEYLKVRVTAVERGQFRGVVICEVMAALISPEKLRKGSMVTFRMNHIVEIADGVELARWPGGKLDDNRSRPGGPLEVGQVAGLRFDPEYPPPNWPCPVDVRVTAVENGRYQGEVIGDVLTHSVKLTAGMVLRFVDDHVFDMADEGGLSGYGNALPASPRAEG